MFLGSWNLENGIEGFVLNQSVARSTLKGGGSNNGGLLVAFIDYGQKSEQQQ